MRANKYNPSIQKSPLTSDSSSLTDLSTPQGDHNNLGNVNHDKSRFNMKTSQGRAMYDLMEEFSLTRLSKNFIMRDFLHSNYNSVAGICNYPEKPDVVIKAGKALCERVLEPITEKWGKVFITFGYQCREAIELANPNHKKNPRSSGPHHWDRGTFGASIYARIDILPACVQDGEVTKKEFRDWMFHNLDLDLIMSWGSSCVFCLTYSEFKPRRVALEWVKSGTGENGTNRVTYYGGNYWLNVWPFLLEAERPKYGPSNTNGSIRWSGNR